MFIIDEKQILENKVNYNELPNGTYCVVENKNILKFVYSILETQILKEQLLNKDSIICKMIKKIINKNYYLILYKCINEEIEQYHHTSFYGVLKIINREYIIKDMYYLHELAHIANLSPNYSNNIFEKWKIKMMYEELYASMFSEIIIYFDTPKLRDYSKNTLKLQNNILVDNFLNNSIKLNRPQCNFNLYTNNYILFIKKLMKYYLKNLFFEPKKNINNFIFDFRLNNLIWLEIWKSKYKNIESKIYNFVSSGNYINHILYLKNESKQNIDKIPFSQEAHIFYEFIQSRINSNNIIIPYIDSGDRNQQKYINNLKIKYGIIKSVILSPIQEVLKIIKKFKKSDEYIFLQMETFKCWQDYYGKELINLTKRFLNYVTDDIDHFTNGYIYSGTNEAHNKLLMIIKRENKNLNLLESDYEGYKILAKDYGINIIIHKRSNILNSIQNINEGDYFWISNPNSMNGCIINNFDEIMKIIDKKKGKVYIDMIYVGTFSKKYKFNLNYDCIYAISWSPSKSFPGMFYYRIGILLTKINYTEFESSRWFHNMESIRICNELLSTYDPFYIPNKYKIYQQKCKTQIEKIIKYPLICSDCVWLLYSEKPDNINTKLNHYYREKSNIIRLTISEFILRKSKNNYFKNQYKKYSGYNFSEIII